MTFKIGDLVEVETKFHGSKPAIIIEQVSDMGGSSWEVFHIQEHWTKTTIAHPQDLKLIQHTSCNVSTAVVQ